MASRGSTWRRFAFMLALAMFEFFMVMRSPRFPELHNVDILQLIVVGVCIGVAMSIAVTIIRASRNP